MLNDREAILSLKREVAEMATVDLLDDVIVVQNLAELGQRQEIGPWEFRARWQELSRRGYLHVH